MKCAHYPTNRLLKPDKARDAGVVPGLGSYVRPLGVRPLGIHPFGIHPFGIRPGGCALADRKGREASFRRCGDFTLIFSPSLFFFREGSKSPSDSLPTYIIPLQLLRRLHVV